MKVHLARWVAATLNVLLSLVTAALFSLFIALRPLSSLTNTSAATLVDFCFYALLAIVSMTTAVLLLRRRTLQTGLKLHFGLTNAVLLYLLISTLFDVSGEANHHLTPAALQSFYWGVAFCGLWFGTGLTLKTLMGLEVAQHNDGFVCSAIEHATQVKVSASALPVSTASVGLTNHSEPLTQKIRG